VTLLESASASAGPVMLHLDTLARPVRFMRHRVPGYGNRYTPDVRAILPPPIQRMIRNLFSLTPIGLCPILA
jgi:hypothetical protein